MQKPSSPHSNVIPAGTVVTANTAFGLNGTTGSTAYVNSGGYANLVLSANVTAHAGTSPTLSLQLQDSADGGNTWNNVGSAISFTTTNQTSVQRITGPIGGKLQVVATVGGTSPSYTLSCDLYGTPN